MRKIYSAIRVITLTVIILAIAIYLLAFILLSTPGIQDKAREIGVEELSQVLGSEVTIDHIQITPFNKLALYDVCLLDQQGDTLLLANKISAGIALSKLIYNEELIFTNIQLFGVDVRITQESPDTPTNLQFVIDAFKRKEEKPKSKLKFRINNAIIRQGKARYDLLSAPRRNDGAFDPNHIAIENLRSKLSIKSLTGDSVNISVKRLGFDEQSGFSLNRFQVELEGNRQQVELSEFEALLPNSAIRLAPLTITLPDSLTAENLYRHTPVELRILPSTLVPDDWSAFVPAFSEISTPLNLSARSKGRLDNLSINPFEIDFGNGSITANSEISLKNIADSIGREISAQTELLATAEGISSLSQYLPLSPSVGNILSRLGEIGFNGTIKYTGNEFSACGKVGSERGNLHADMRLHKNNKGKKNRYYGLIETEGFDLNGLFAEGNPYGNIIFQVELDCLKAKGETPAGSLSGTIAHFDYKEYPYENITLNGTFDENRYDGIVQIDDPNGKVEVKGFSVFKEKESEFDLSVQAQEVRLADLHLLPQYPHSELGFNLVARFVGNHLDNAEGSIEVDTLTFAYNDSIFTLNQFDIEARNQQTPQRITITSDFLNGGIEGKYQFSELAGSLKNLIAESLPSLFPNAPTNKNQQEPDSTTVNRFRFHFGIEPNVHMAEMFNLPITFTDRATIEGEIDSRENTCLIEGTLPHFWVKKTHIEDTHIWAQKTDNIAQLSVEAKSYSKKQIPTVWSLQGITTQDMLDLNIGWDKAGETSNYGEVNAITSLVRIPETGDLLVEAQINPSNIVINDSTWIVKPSQLSYCDQRIEIKDFEVSHAPQYIHITGAASTQEEDELTVRLNNMSLDYIFETLHINHVVFGGSASGEIAASHLFTEAPHLNTKDFYVKDFSYNKAILGDLQLFSKWNVDNQGILLDGTVMNAEQRETYIHGHIFPTRDSLYLAFKPDRLNIAFLNPFINTIMDDVTGVATGEIDFYGNFKRLNVKGDAYLEDGSFGVKHLNTRYTVTDHIHMSPTSIRFDNVTVYDKHNHTAKGTGEIRHKHFKDLAFDINIFDMQDILAYDVPEQQSPVYYGTIFASEGNVSITGKPGSTTINVVATAGDNSTFTFDMSSGGTSAGDYDFITFTDSQREAAERERQKTISMVEWYNARMMESVQEEEEVSGLFDLNLDVTVDNQSHITLVTDKNTGDRIKATGKGNVLLNYNSGEDNIDMQGSYTLDQGNYSFSLQDIISRNFIIKEDSKVEFHGDPMATTLNITAYYPLHASLLDLDESFANDPNLQQTTQQVHAILHITGDLLKPDLSFELGFPNLERTSPEVIRRIESLISTDDMMTRQIIYLLALKRFYTPDYMNSGINRNNNTTGLAVVASSTIAAQLGNILGDLSENWNIAPNLRSDKGDFSDMEVELALSSQLLNNRLIFNGNFGYRNNTVNSNTFIGDFDLEYLLNKSGTVRLKAYNHYNDRNYTIKSALTTQGVGLMFRRDFDNWRDLLRPENKPKLRLPEKNTRLEIEVDNKVLQEEMTDANQMDFESNEAIE